MVRGLQDRRASVLFTGYFLQRTGTSSFSPVRDARAGADTNDGEQRAAGAAHAAAG
jgi:hypothetical protein